MAVVLLGDCLNSSSSWHMILGIAQLQNPLMIIKFEFDNPRHGYLAVRVIGFVRIALTDLCSGGSRAFRPGRASWLALASWRRRRWRSTFPIEQRRSWALPRRRKIRKSCVRLCLVLGVSREEISEGLTSMEQDDQGF